MHSIGEESETQGKRAALLYLLYGREAYRGIPVCFHLGPPA